ncbi:hypothetical protein [Mobilicoccus pelagius]|uniref:Uncharacterized protein n=1 Tax=Mobilicoccus pelagius NBRC 104925 TaxID=1089455 RepID=H5UVR1_9MICO|nr:hypothetical protein [Mobilicoccus pelagius]GAB49819.1 hypothetical protein MOPEL_135_00570 [Mobilicoccus pelagius NBRC 104925]
MLDRTHRPARARLAGAVALTLGLGLGLATAAPADAAPTTTSVATSATAATAGATAAPALAARTPLPRNCLAEYTTTGRDGIVTSLVYADRRFAAAPYAGWRISPAPRFVEPVGFDETDSSASMVSLVVRPDGVMESVRVTATPVGGVVGTDDTSVPTAHAATTWKAARPVRVGHGWNAVRDIAVPGTEDAPFLFALRGDRLDRYVFGPNAAGDAVVRTGPHAATAGFRSVRSLTWTRETTVRGARADVLVGLDGGRLVEYTVPRTERPRVTKRVLVNRGWGSVSRVDAGACFTSASPQARPTRSVPILGTVGRSIRLYLDRDSRNGSGRDIANYGEVGRRP